MTESTPPAWRALFEDYSAPPVKINEAIGSSSLEPATSKKKVVEAPKGKKVAAKVEVEEDDDSEEDSDDDSDE